jgi:hypothetical protein
MANPATLSTLLQHPYVLGVFSRLKPAGRAFQQAYSMGAANIATEPSNINRHVVYDIFDHSRTNAQGRGPMVGPARISAKPVGQAHATAMRLYEALDFPYERIYSIRQLGGQFGPLDATGQSWVLRQQMFMAERFSNAIEFMISRMFRGGFSINIEGDNYTLGELGAGTIDVPYQIPAGNKTTLGGLIDAEWDLAGTKIINHMLEINKLSQLQTGYEIRHIWINSTTYKHMLANTQLQSVRGTAMRVFEQYSPANVETTGASRNIGFTVVFPAMPQFLVHVYDGTSVVGSQVDPVANTTSTDSYYIPDGIAIMTPEVELGGWHGMYHGTEPIRENDDSEAALKTGLASWSKRTNDPPGEELRVLHNLVPLLYIPKAVFYATVWT